jgi:hypothetical protein
MSENLLDPQGDAEVPMGYHLVESEVAFLVKACLGDPLFVRGPRLCRWAQAFFSGRNIAYREVVSPTRELQSIFPELNSDGVQAVLGKMGNAYWGLARPLTPQRLLQELFPDRLWATEPSLDQAAEWLLWLWRQDPPDWASPVIAAVARRWQVEAESALAVLYGARNRVDALLHLDAWLGISESDEAASLGVFPHPVPDQLKQRARVAWLDQLTTSQGARVEHLLMQPLPPELRSAVAQEALSYYLLQPQYLTRSRFSLLLPHLYGNGQDKLLNLLHPDPPPSVPETASDVLRWFTRSYLPYRTWQSAYGGTREAEVANAAARQFALWYLGWYPRALAGDPARGAISFIRAASEVRARDEAVTLLVALDGLHVGDAQLLRTMLPAEARRLMLLDDGLAMAPIPTVTSFAKTALFRGVPPVNVPSFEPIAVVLSENTVLSDRLAGAQPASCYIWTVVEPDRTYHKRDPRNTLLTNAKTELEGIVRKLTELVDRLPGERRLRIIITSDHGRLLAGSERTEPVPPGWQSHGRAAWGTPSGRQYPASGYLVEGDVAYLHADRFGLALEAAICLGDATFETNDGRAGTEAFPHGGVYPEEVVVPWLVFERDYQEPRLDSVVSGSGRARSAGEAAIRITNINDFPVHLVRLRLVLKRGEEPLALDATVAARGTYTDRLPLSRWPSAGDLRGATLEVDLRRPTGQELTVPGRVDLQTEDMYKRETSLEDLEL